MSRETIFKDGAWVDGYEFSNHATLMEDIAKKENELHPYKERLLALAMATPKDITPDGGDPMEHIKLTFDELWDEVQEILFHLHALYLIEHNEEYIDNATD